MIRVRPVVTGWENTDIAPEACESGHRATGGCAPRAETDAVTPPSALRSLAVLVALTGVLGIRTGGAAEAPIRPGAFMDAPAGCTLNFVFADDSALYIGTAGHCTDRIGDRVSTPATGAFGTVVYRRLAGWDDVALIRIDQDQRSRVGIALERFGAPTGVTLAAETAAGDAIGLEGNGVLLGEAAATRSRIGVLGGDTDGYFVAELPALFGDSGGPVVHLGSGKALGVVSGIAPTVPPGTFAGTTIDRMLILASQAGFALRLVTA